MTSNGRHARILQFTYGAIDNGLPNASKHFRGLLSLKRPKRPLLPPELVGPYTYIHAHIHKLQTYMHCKYTHIHTLHTYIHTYTYIHYKHTYTYTYIHKLQTYMHCKHTHIHTNTHTYIRTYIHTLQTYIYSLHTNIHNTYLHTYIQLHCNSECCQVGYALAR
jgi:hypothetical protein